MSDEIEKIQSKRDELEGLAESDNHAAWVAKELLEIVDDD